MAFEKLQLTDLKNIGDFITSFNVSTSFLACSKAIGSMGKLSISRIRRVFKVPASDAGNVISGQLSEDNVITLQRSGGAGDITVDISSLIENG